MIRDAGSITVIQVDAQPRLVLLIRSLARREPNLQENCCTAEREQGKRTRSSHMGLRFFSLVELAMQLISAYHHTYAQVSAKS